MNDEQLLRTIQALRRLGNSPAAQQLVPQLSASYMRDVAEECEESLHAFIRHFWGELEPETPFIDGRHLHAIVDHLEAVRAGTITKLMINIPPGLTKSLSTCVFFPAWTWISDPSRRFLHTSYDQELSTRDSLRTRRLIESPLYQQLWGHRFRLVGDQNEKKRFDNSKRGWRLATSVGGRGTGEHPHFVVMDDLHNVKRSESRVDRQAVRDYVDGTLSSRGVHSSVRSRFICVMQRLHERDAAGHLMQRDGVVVEAGDPGWVHLNLPMHYDPARHCRTILGFSDWRTSPRELLAPQSIGPDAVADMQRALGPLRASAQLEQDPKVEGGFVFLRDWFPRIHELPADIVQFVRFWDKAGSEREDADETAGCLAARRSNGRYIILDMAATRLAPAERTSFIRQVADQDAAAWGEYTVSQVLEEEGGAGGKTCAMVSRISLSGHNVATERPVTNKYARATAWSGWAKDGWIEILDGPWVDDFLDQLTLFPKAEHDDQVDAASGAMGVLMRCGGNASGRPKTFSGEDGDNKPLGQDEIAALPERLRGILEHLE